MNDVLKTILPRSDQLNAEQLIIGPMTIKVTGVEVKLSNEQPIWIHYENEQGRPYKPCKSMRRAIIKLWGEDAATWTGKSMTLYNDPSVSFGKEKNCGGIRISAMSHLQAESVELNLTVSRGKKMMYTFKRLTVDNLDSVRDSLTAAAKKGLDALKTAWTELPAQTRSALGAAYLDELKALASKPVSAADVLNAAAAENTTTTNEETP